MGKHNRRQFKGLPTKQVTQAQADAWITRVKEAPILDIPPGRSVTKHVARVGILNPNNPMNFLMGEQLFPWIELTNGDVYRLPDDMANWARDTVSIILGAGGNAAVGMFPAHIEFSANGIRILEGD